MNYGPSIPLARLYERVSKTGNHYLAGRLGLAKIVILKSSETAEDGTPIWNVLVQEAPAKPDRNAAEREGELRRVRDVADDEPARRNWQRPAGGARTNGNTRARTDEADALNDPIPF